jgi:hypothetical protein
MLPNGSIGATGWEGMPVGKPEDWATLDAVVSLCAYCNQNIMKLHISFMILYYKMHDGWPWNSRCFLGFQDGFCE